MIPESGSSHLEAVITQVSLRKARTSEQVLVLVEHGVKKGTMLRNHNTIQKMPGRTGLSSMREHKRRNIKKGSSKWHPIQMQ